MKNLDDLTVVIVTFQTPEKIILDCLNSINKSVNVIIVENSKIFSHEYLVKSKFSNVKVFCTGENIGYGKGNNFGLEKVDSNYALILNPDVICEEKLFDKIPNVVNKINNFAVIGFQYSFDKIFIPAGFFDEKKNSVYRDEFKENKIESISSVEWVTGCSMLINLKEFKNKKIFDENFFLYFEETEYCFRAKNKGYLSYQLNKSKVKAKGRSVNVENENESLSNILIWHFIWSKFYFYKKKYGKLLSLIIFIPIFIRILFKVILYKITKNEILLNKYKSRLDGLLKSMMGEKSNLRP